MSLEALEQEIAKLDVPELEKIICYAVLVKRKRMRRSVDDLTERLDDPGRWIPIEEAERRLGIAEDAPG